MMSSQVTLVVIRGDTVRFENTITDYDGGPLEPDSHVIQLLKPDGTQEGDDMISPSGSAGSYTQDVDIPIDGPHGEWVLEWQIFVGVAEDAKRSTERTRFRVVD